jgi:hypothetical protein
VRIAVVDPRLLVKAFAYPRSTSAKLLALFAYGRVCMLAHGYALEELDEMVQAVREQGGDINIDVVRDAAQRNIEESRRRKARMENAFGGGVVPDEYVMVVSQELLDEVEELAQKCQLQGLEHVHPDVVRRHVIRHSVKAVTDVGIVPSYLARGQVSRHDYLIKVAVDGGAGELITDDLVLQLPGDAYFTDPSTRGEVRPYSLEDFVASLPHFFDMDDVDARAVLRAAVERI